MRHADQPALGVPVFFAVVGQGEHDGHEVYLNGHPVAFRAYDGRDTDDVVQEVSEALGELLLERLAQKNYPYGFGSPGDWHAKKPDHP